MKKALKIFGFIILAIALVLGSIIAYATISDYDPEEEIVVSTSNKADIIQIDSAGYQLNFLSWNIGYCGLNKEMDFFYDGGKQVYPEKEVVEKNILGVENFLKNYKGIDFLLMQEVDVNSMRSYHINEVEKFSNDFVGYSSSLGINYNVFFVPVPFTNPMGSVESGILTISKYQPKEVVRHSYIGNYSWPKGLFMLDRCFLVNRYPTSNNKELIVINTHNSAYDDGTLRIKQMKQLSIFLKAEYAKGNYIIVGGDWNQCPPDFKPEFKNQPMDNIDKINIKADYLEGWTWAFDNKNPTNRRVDIPYTKGKTLTTVIDFFLLSPNIEKISLENIPNGFVNSDHQPVKAEFKLLFQ